ncbi:MAG: nickel pincer cofactor biosynthesis protein LarC [Synergistaceae bacterium]|nr:nickel pincer cofactor biosynthesis protein LarC [Synergistota bacterium]NLM70996.1 nickel pincer cofactor biosynthesis protein LarC [Synergistaceae bacterium]
MRTLYLDCFAGIAGDMFLGAMLDLGLDEAEFLRTMRELVLFPQGHGHHSHHHGEGPRKHPSITVARTSRGGIAAAKVNVASFEDHPHRGLSDILAIIDASPLSLQVKERSVKAFRLLAEAEGKVHGMPPEEVHFHEVGAIDSIVDIIGAFVLLEMAEVDRVVSSPLNVGHGTIKCAHGILPVPAPATAELLEGLPVRVEGGPMERVTPTGALLVRMLAESFGPIPNGKLLASGKGAGDRESDIPNVLRVMLLEADETAEDGFLRDSGVIIETNIDDMNPQYYSPVIERLMAEGALDAWATPILMKKGRPATTLGCLCNLGSEEKFARLIIRETTTLGVRMHTVRRLKANAEVVERETKWGRARYKIARTGDGTRVNPEYEDVSRMSAEQNIPLSDMRELLLAEYGDE